MFRVQISTNRSLSWIKNAWIVRNYGTDSKVILPMHEKKWVILHMRGS